MIFYIDIDVLSVTSCVTGTKGSRTGRGGSTQRHAYRHAQAAKCHPGEGAGRD